MTVAHPQLAKKNAKPSVGVIGSASICPYSSDHWALEEILYHVTQNALSSAGIGINDIDGIVVAGNDQIDGRAISIMAASGSVGGVDRDILSTPSSSEHAFIMGAVRVRSGLFQTQLIVAWSPIEVSSIGEAQRLAADPYFHRLLPLDELASHALQASAIIARTPDAEPAARAVVAKNRRNGLRTSEFIANQAIEPVNIGSGRMLRWPISEDMVGPITGGAVALVIASDKFISERCLEEVAWLDGMGWSTESGFLGDRNLSSSPGLFAAGERAYRFAGIEDPVTQIDVAEVADATAYQELLAYEGLGLCRRESWWTELRGGHFDRTGKMPVNVSGGSLFINPVFCTGLRSIAAAAGYIRHRRGLPATKRAMRSLAHGASGFAMQYNTVVVFGAERAEPLS